MSNYPPCDACDNEETAREYQERQQNPAIPSAIPTKAGNWKVYVYSVPIGLRLNDPIVRRYVYLSSARAAVKRFAAQGKRAIVADDPKGSDLR